MKARGGFTLVELMVALVVAGTLAAVAYPGYQLHVLRARRTEAQVALQALMQQQERYFTQHNRYAAFGAEAGGADAQLFRWWSGATPAGSAYEIVGRACDGEDIADCLELVAMPGTDRVDNRHRDPLCDRLILTSNGRRLSTGPAARCWR